MRILLIDDSSIDRELAERALASLPAPPGPAEVLTAEDWASAKRLIDTGGVDLVLLDFHLPDANGLEVLAELGRMPRLPVIMLTGQDDPGTAVETLRAGAQDYVSKSSSARWGRALCITVERVVERMKLEQEVAVARVRLAAHAAELEEKVGSRTATVYAQAREIERLYLELDDAARIKDEIIANASHELRTPLNAILGYTGILQDELPNDPIIGAHDMLGKIRSQAERLHAMLESLLNLAQLRAHTVGVSVSRFDLRALLDDLRADAEVLNADKGLHLAWKVPAEPCEVENDLDKVRAIAFQLLTNAIKFTPEGEVAVAAEALADGGIRFSVADTGIGVSVDAAPQIFDDFYQLDGSSTRQYDGLGLGLGIVKRLTALLGGAVRLDSVPGKGTTIAVEIPRPPARDRVGATSRRPPARTRTPVGRRTSA